MIQATIQFNTNKGGHGDHSHKWTTTRIFAGDEHLDNYLAWMRRNKGYTLDEIWTKKIDNYENI